MTKKFLWNFNLTKLFHFFLFIIAFFLLRDFSLSFYYNLFNYIWLKGSNSGWKDFISYLNSLHGYNSFILEAINQCKTLNNMVSNPTKLFEPHYKGVQVQVSKNFWAENAYFNWGSIRISDTQNMILSSVAAAIFGIWFYSK